MRLLQFRGVSGAESIEVMVEIVHLVLQCLNLRIDLFELVGIFEAIGATVRGIVALKFEVPTSLTWSASIAFDLSSFTLITTGYVSVIYNTREFSNRSYGGQDFMELPQFQWSRLTESI
jgi:hypothetical protein